MAISPERQARLIQIAQSIQANPELLAKLTGETPEISPGLVAGEAGIQSPVSKTTAGQLTSEAIRRAKPETVQTLEERTRGRKSIFGDLLKGKVVGGREAVPTGITEEGSLKFDVEKTPEEILKEKTASAIATESAKTGAKLGEGQRASERSLSVISTTLNDFSKTLVDAFDEGGFGDVIKASKTALKQKFAGGLATKELARTSEIPGKKVEIITKMMPLLTQQGDKPGSVRLVSTVFERLADSLPGANLRGDVRGNDISLEESRGMLSSTILSMLRFAQAIQSLGITNEDVDRIPGKLTQNPNGSTSVEKGSELSKFGDLIERVSQQFFTEGSEEEQQIQEFISLALKPLDDKIAEENTRIGEGGTEAGTLSPEDEAELSDIDRQIAELRGK